MSLREEPLVSILTPVYNGEPYLIECIESVLAQTFQNWEYIIVNNCSTDGTLKIAQEYARKDPRIRVHTNKHFVGVIENHNIAFRLISPSSRYCKIVCADDWIYPECLTQMVKVAEQHSSIGLVGSYAIYSEGVRWIGLPIGTNFFNGREVCRLNLLGAEVFGPPTSVLYRSDLVKKETTFFTGSAPNADIDATYRLLQHSDFGFVHQILSFDRVHVKAVSSKLRSFNSFLVDRLEFVINYGHIYLNRDEYEDRLEELSRTYYKYLAEGLINFRGTEFWDHHKSRITEIGVKFAYTKLAKAIFNKLFDLFFNPKRTIEGIARRINHSKAERTERSQ